MTTRIAIVEDEKDLARSMAFAFEQEGIEAATFGDGDSALRSLREHTFDLVLLDLMLPDMSGLDICRALRTDEAFAAYQEVPIIMVTASGDEVDRVHGFEVGADDYVVKPFSLRELILRVKAVLRRRSPKTQTENTNATEVIFGRLRVDRSGCRVYVDDAERKVTMLELKLLDTLLKRKGRVQTRETLLSDVWGVSPELTTRTVDTHVKRLREKLGPMSNYIETVRGFGYRFCAEPVSDAPAEGSSSASADRGD